MLNIIETSDFPERLCNKCLDLFVSLDGEPKSWELAAAVTYELVRQNARKNSLQSQRLESCKCCTCKETK